MNLKNSSFLALLGRTFFFHGFNLRHDFVQLAVDRVNFILERDFLNLFDCDISLVLSCDEMSKASNVAGNRLVGSAEGQVSVVLMPSVNNLEVVPLPEHEVSHEDFDVQDDLVILHVGVLFFFFLDTAVHVTEDGNEKVHQ
jgi:hypothetical protein